MTTQITATQSVTFFNYYVAINRMFARIADAREMRAVETRGELLSATFYAAGPDRFGSADDADVTPQEAAIEAAYRVLPGSRLVTDTMADGDILIGNIGSPVWFRITTDGDIWPADANGHIWTAQL